MIAKNESIGKHKTACGLGFPGFETSIFSYRVRSTLKKVKTTIGRFLDACFRVDKSEAYRSARVGPAGPGGFHGRMSKFVNQMSKAEE
jgi:hypothetical protein